MTEWKIPLYKIYWDDDDVEAVSRVIRRGMYWTGGPSVANFENEVASISQRQYAVSFNSGTSGQLAMLIAQGIGPGDEVIVPSFTFISTCNTVVLAGATPVFAEIEPTGYGLDPIDVERKITPSTKAIVPVHYGGGACKIDEIIKIAKKYDIIVLEDAAESFGSEYNNRPIGSDGFAAMFSFCGNKVMSTGEGGMVVTDDAEYAEALRLIRSHGRVGKGNYFTSSESFDYVELGYNWRMSDITAELGLSMLDKLEFLIKSRRELAKIYTEKLQDLSVTCPVGWNPKDHIFQMYTIRFKSNHDRERVRRALTEARIMSKIYFDCAHLTTYYRRTFGTKPGDLPVTENIASTVLTLPMYPSLTENEIYEVCSIIRNTLNKE